MRHKAIKISRGLGGIMAAAAEKAPQDRMNHVDSPLFWRVCPPLLILYLCNTKPTARIHGQAEKAQFR
ncbi:MAG: hypothetical protein CME88_12420 [Hirschia sp.]|nr:hypothetical protein [Hirschia sp.]